MEQRLYADVKTLVRFVGCGMFNILCCKFMEAYEVKL